MSVLIRGVRLYGEGDRVDVLVDDGQIAEIGPGLAIPDTADVIDATDHVLLPVGVEAWPCRVGDALEGELPGLDAVMMLRVQAERMHGAFFPSSREYAVRYGLSESRAALLPEHAVVLHPGPMVRGMEIAPAVADAPSSAVLAQVQNGVHVRMAVLYHLLAGAAA